MLYKTYKTELWVSLGKQIQWIGLDFYSTFSIFKYTYVFIAKVNVNPINGFMVILSCWPFSNINLYFPIHMFWNILVPYPHINKVYNHEVYLLYHYIVLHIAFQGIMIDCISLYNPQKKKVRHRFIKCSHIYISSIFI